MYRKKILFVTIILCLFVLLFCPPLLEKAVSLFSPEEAPPSYRQDYSARQEPSSDPQDSSLQDTGAALSTTQMDELTALMEKRYGYGITLQSCQGTLCTFLKEMDRPAEGTFLFQAEYTSRRDNYLQELLHFLGDFYPCQNMSIQWKETGEGLSREYTPVFIPHSWGGFSLNAYCENICDFLEYCMEDQAFSQNPGLISSFTLSFAGSEADYQDVSLDAYQRVEFFNRLYAFADAFTVSALNAANTPGSENSVDSNKVPLSPQIADYYLGLKAACAFSMGQETEYRLVAVDRAAGSSYYSLIVVTDKGETCILVNPDPYNGSGGDARWLTFLDDKLGFSCLAYSGGSYGSLYRTEDGGLTFTSVEYPSSMAALPDGTYYNPFVMPDKVYQEDGQLYLVAGQGPEGDYYGDTGWCSGLYRSEDQGKSWIYVGEIPVEDTRPN